MKKEPPFYDIEVGEEKLMPQDTSDKHIHKWVKHWENGGQIGRGWIYICECGACKEIKNPIQDTSDNWKLELNGQVDFTDIYELEKWIDKKRQEWIEEGKKNPDVSVAGVLGFESGMEHGKILLEDYKKRLIKEINKLPIILGESHLAQAEIKDYLLSKLK